MRKLKLKTKLQGAFLLISLVGAIVASIGIYNMSEISKKADLMYSKELLGLSHIKEANINLIYIGRARSNLLLSSNQEERDKNATNIAKYQKQLNENLEAAKNLVSSDKIKQLFEKYEQESVAYQEGTNNVLSMIKKEDFTQISPELKDAANKTRTVANKLDDIMSDIAEVNEENAKNAASESTNLYHNSRNVMIILVLLSLASGITIGLLVSDNITKKIGGEPDAAVKIANKIASGDLTQNILIKDNDKVSLLFAMKGMQQSLLSIVSQVRVSTDTISTAANEIANGNLDLSNRTESQASSLEETASSMEEMTSTVKQNADNASQARKVSETAADKAKRGGQEMHNVVSTMTDIQNSSKEMENIITTIESIAFQTNILALNAAVEAARAGEQGRGFAVVASEVRNLAHRSAGAAKEIKELINDSVSKIEVGTKQAKAAGETVNDIASSISKVNDLISEISAASSEQSAGIEQINSAIIQMDNVTQSNAALVEEAAAASQSMEEQVSKLSSIVSVFKTESSNKRALLS